MDTCLNQDSVYAGAWLLMSVASGNLPRCHPGPRPFAPAVREEEADEYFELPANCHLGEMTVVVPVREAWQERLGAVTHVDGTARVQVVAADTQPDFHALLTAFRQHSGLGVLLNTSFNNSYEPIVDSPADAIRTFLITDLDLLVIGPWIVERTQPTAEFLASCVAAPRPDAVLVRTVSDGDVTSIGRGARPGHLQPGAVVAAWTEPAIAAQYWRVDGLGTRRLIKHHLIPQCLTSRSAE